MCPSRARRANWPPASRRSCAGRRNPRGTKTPWRACGPGPLLIMPSTRTARWCNHPLDLTGAEFNLLEVLARNAGQLVSKQDLSKRAFGRPLTPFDRRIDVHISSVGKSSGCVRTANPGFAPCAARTISSSKTVRRNEPAVSETLGGGLACHGPLDGRGRQHKLYHGRLS